MKPFIPHELPPDLDWQKLVPLIGKANAAIARYDGLLQSLINPSVLLSPFTTNEAVLSSRIEGTQASLGEVLEHDAGLNTGKSPAINEDIKEISNYRKVLRIAEDELKIMVEAYNTKDDEVDNYEERDCDEDFDDDILETLKTEASVLKAQMKMKRKEVKVLKGVCVL